MAFSKIESYKFIGSPQPDTIIGERVVMRAPLQLPKLGPLRNFTLEAFLKSAEEQFLDLMRKHGQDCSDFEITLDQGRLSVIFTRPMDVVEETQIRTARLRGFRPGAGQSDEAIVARKFPSVQPGDPLPDPSVALGLPSVA